LQIIEAEEYRRGVVISGNEAWSRAKLAQLYGMLKPANALWLADALSCLPDYAMRSGRLVTRGQVVSLLGSESDVLIVDGYSGLNPDSVAALAGSIVKGGVVIVLAPLLDQWASFNDPEYQKIAVYPYTHADIPGLFLQHFSRVLGQYCDNDHFIKLDINTDDEALEIIAKDFCPHFNAESIAQGLSHGKHQFVCSDSQQRVVEAVNRVCTGHRKRPLVLTADRGRGKSAAIGMALADLIQTSVPYHFVVTAPSLVAVDRLFAHCAEMLGVALDAPGELSWQGSTVRYCLPGLVEEQLGVTMLVVDEAAAIGTAMLTQWLGAFSRMVFSSTVHGYEGSGQGFSLRFQQTLTQVMPQHKCITLTEPIRWREGDKVEAFINAAFLLNADVDNIGDSDGNSARIGTSIDTVELADLEVDGAAPLICIRRIDRVELVKQTSLLTGLFGLLITAHYKTTPGDLRNLLDGPNLEVFVATHHDGATESVVGGLLLAKEGAFDEALASAIWQGQRRPRGHVIPQTLAVQCGYEGALKFKSARIIRVAVNPRMQQQGLGKRLVKAAESYSKLQGFEWLGSSFGATEALVHFWGACGLNPVRVGISLDGASGSYSTLVLAPLCEIVEPDFVLLRKRFYDHFLLALKNYYQKMPSELLLCLLKRGDGKSITGVSAIDIIAGQRDVDGFLQYQWPYDVVFPSLQRWFLGLLFSGNIIAPSGDISLLVELFIRQQSLKRAVEVWGKGGEKAFIKMVKIAVANVNENVSNLH